MNWASAGVAAYVDKIILENGYGCNVTVVTGDTMPTFASMNEKGQPDMAPEFWVKGRHGVAAHDGAEASKTRPLT